MNGTKLFLETNIIIYLFNGDKTLADLINGKSIFISFVTQLEFLSYPDISEHEAANLNSFLSDCTIIDINSEIKEMVISIRKKYRMKLPDSIIVATALHLDLPIVTADQGLVKIDQLESVYYERNQL